MNTLKVNHAAILIGSDGRKFYVMYDAQGNAHTFTNSNGHLADHSIHRPVSNGFSCEFLGGNPCNSEGRTTGQIHDESKIFDLLNESISRSN